MSLVAAASLLGVAACSDDQGSDSPAPGGSVPQDSTVQAPNGTNMGATPLNADSTP